MAYEISEQLGWSAPGWMIVPAGNGGLAAGLHQGFRELACAKIVSRLPRLVAVQAERCAPIWKAWSEGSASINGDSGGQTAAEGIAVARPVRGDEVLEALRESNGLVHTVSEDSIRTALAAMGKRGLYIEPTSATAVAAVSDLISRGTIPAGDQVVVTLTGSGLKATDKIVHHLLH